MKKSPLLTYPCCNDRPASNTSFPDAARIFFFACDESVKEVYNLASMNNSSAWEWSFTLDEG